MRGGSGALCISGGGLEPACMRDVTVEPGPVASTRVETGNDEAAVDVSNANETLVEEVSEDKSYSSFVTMISLSFGVRAHS